MVTVYFTLTLNDSYQPRVNLKWLKIDEHEKIDRHSYKAMSAYWKYKTNTFIHSSKITYRQTAHQHIIFPISSTIIDSVVTFHRQTFHR